VTISLHRLLLAVLYRCYGELSYNGEWQEVWKDGNGAFDPAKSEGYLRRKDYPVRSGSKGGSAKTIDIFERFYLFDDRHPFYQFPGIDAPKAGEYSAAKLLFHDEGSAVLFEHLLKWSPPELNPARAARLLIAFQAFDTHGTKSSLPGISKYAEKSPLLNAAVGLARGKNLFGTLMLNLYWDDKEFFRRHLPRNGKLPEDLPAWENDEIFSEYSREPNGYLDLLTWQSRRIKLFPSSGEKPVTQVFIVPGARFIDGFRRYDKEPMIAFRKSDQDYKPIAFQPNRVLWRDSHAIFQIVRETDRKHSLLLLDWLANLNLSAEEPIPIDFFGMTSEGKEARMLFWRHERLPLPTRYLREEDISRELQRALSFCDKQVFEVLRESIRRFTVLILWPDCYGKEESSAYFRPLFNSKAEADAKTRQRKFEIEKRGKDFPKTVDKRSESFNAGTHYWPRLENAFRALLLGLARDPNDWPGQRERWAKAVERAAKQTMREVIGGTADSTRTLRAIAIAQNWFEAKFNAVRKRYLKGGIVSTEFDETDESDEDDEQDDDE
jgi:CRISPR system Cascade subunit CasA